jgi:hypothetical protein
MNQYLKILFFINFCVNNFLMSAQLNYGDAICLYLNGTNSFFLSTKTTDSGYIPAAKKFNLVETNESIKFYIQPGNSINRFDDCGQNNKVKSGDIIRLETSTHSKTNQPSYLGYNYSSGLGAERTPILYKSAFENPASTSLKPNVLGYVFKIFKINPTVDTISEGDSIVLAAYYKNSSTFIPFYLGAKESVNDKNQADLIFAYSTTQDNPTDFPAKYSWFVSTIIANAYISDALVYDNKPIVNKDISDLNTSIPPVLSNVTLNSNQKVPLRYGDGFVLRHKEHGTYLSLSGGEFSPVIATTELTTASKWLAEVGDEVYSYGLNNNNRLGVPLKSGDYIRMGNFDYFNPTGRDLRQYMFSFSRPQTPFPNGKLIAYCHKFGACTRIYKYGGNVGSPILKGDTVYIYSYYRSNQYGIQPETDQYLGSGINKEVFVYQSRPLSSNIPQNFSTQYLWIVEDIYPNSQESLPASGNWSLSGVGGTGVENINSPNIWPSVSSRQF